VVGTAPAPAGLPLGSQLSHAGPRTSRRTLSEAFLSILGCRSASSCGGTLALCDCASRMVDTYEVLSGGPKRQFVTFAM
jgi:hypothetical protein